MCSCQRRNKKDTIAFVYTACLSCVHKVESQPVGVLAGYFWRKFGNFEEHGKIE